MRGHASPWQHPTGIRLPLVENWDGRAVVCAAGEAERWAAVANCAHLPFDLWASGTRARAWYEPTNTNLIQTPGAPIEPVGNGGSDKS